MLNNYTECACTSISTRLRLRLLLHRNLLYFEKFFGFHSCMNSIWHVIYSTGFSISKRPNKSKKIRSIHILSKIVGKILNVVFIIAAIQLAAVKCTYNRKTKSIALIINTIRSKNSTELHLELYLWAFFSNNFFRSVKWVCLHQRARNEKKTNAVWSHKAQKLNQHCELTKQTNVYESALWIFHILALRNE